MNQVSVKSESYICNCCLACDRNLEPLGKYSDVFQKIMQGKTSIIQNMNLSAMHICWECSALLKRILHFQAKAENAQFVLQLAELQNMMYPPLTTLNTIIITENSYEYYNYEDEEKIEIKLDLNDKVETGEEDIDDHDFNDNNYDDNELDNEVINVKSELENEKDDIKLDDNIESINNLINLEDNFNDNVIKKWNRSKADKKATAANKFEKIMLNREAVNHKIVTVSHEEVLSLMEKEKNEKDFLKNDFKCYSCIKSYKTQFDLKTHNNKYHKVSCGKYICEICNSRFTNSLLLKIHMKGHYSKYVCVLCDETFYRRYNYYKHNVKYHKQIYQCKECGKRFWRRREFYEHFREMHSIFICDYCNKSFHVKESIIKHIGRRHLNEDSKTCEVCKKKFSSVRNVRTHYKMYHTKSEAYCVECDLMLPNIDLYKRHLRSSVKHRPKKKQSFPCPECGKIYARRCSMNYHYTYVHKQETKFKCEECDRYFLNGFRLRTHKKTKHDKIPPEKNKMCTICGRSFSTNRILENHVRTHTGERPHSCPHCPAAFAQRTAMRVHIRNIHMRSQS